MDVAKRMAVVVPCFNEEAVLPTLARALQSLQAIWASRYRFHFILVDDGSLDDTWNLLEQIFRPWPNCTLVRHTYNRGITAATLTGLRQADTETACAIDSDGSYNIHDLVRMIPLLTDGVDVVTASPYHPDGGVRHIPGWRLWLSRASSALYRLVLRQKLYTYTSCFRVYRRRAVLELPIQETGFQGIAEIVARLDLQGAKIVEYPAVLDVRKFGQSKMKVLRTILGHLHLLSRLVVLRWFGPPPVPMVSLPASRAA
jgi:dolichol-phosphate mannosyltransferase